MAELAPSTACLAALGLPEAPLPELGVVKARWRELAARHHPDRGGDGAMFAALSQAYDEAVALVTAPRRCATCGGSGFQTISYGWSSIDMPCAVCGGVGTQ